MSIFASVKQVRTPWIMTRSRTHWWEVTSADSFFYPGDVMAADAFANILVMLNGMDARQTEYSLRCVRRLSFGKRCILQGFTMRYFKISPYQSYKLRQISQIQGLTLRLLPRDWYKWQISIIKLSVNQTRLLHQLSPYRCLTYQTYSMQLEIFSYAIHVNVIRCQVVALLA